LHDPYNQDEDWGHFIWFCNTVAFLNREPRIPSDFHHLYCSLWISWFAKEWSLLLWSI